MAKKKDQRQNPFLSNEIPPQIERRVLGCYTDLCYELDEQDLKVNHMFKIFNRLQISRKLSLIDFKIQDYCIEGTNIIDVDKLCLRCGFLILLSKSLNSILKQWLSLVKLVPGKLDNLEDEDAVFRCKLTRLDLQQLSEELSLDISKNLDDMLALSPGSSGTINFVEFGVILGKLGQL